MTQESKHTMLAILPSAGERESTCAQCASPFMIHGDMYVCRVNDLQPICQLCAMRTDPRLVELMQVWRARRGKEMSTREMLDVEIDAVSVVKASYSRCLSAEMLAEFYRRLLGKYPLAQRMFKGSHMGRVQQKLGESLLFLIANATSPEILRDKLEHVAAVHSKSQRNVKPEMYTAFIQTMMSTIAYYDPEFDNHVKKAWLQILPVPIRFMMSRYDS